MPLLTLLWVFWGNLRYESKYQITDCIWISLQWRSAKSATCSSQIKFLGVLHKTFPSPSSDVHSGAKFERQFWISWPPGGALLDEFPKSGRGASALWPPGWDKAVTLPANAHPSTKEEDRLSIFTRRPPKWGAAAAAESWHQTRSFRSMLLPIPPPPPSDDMSFQHLWMDIKVQSKKSIINKQHKVSMMNNKLSRQSTVIWIISKSTRNPWRWH